VVYFLVVEVWVCILCGFRERAMLADATECKSNEDKKVVSAGIFEGFKNHILHLYRSMVFAKYFSKKLR
jgi:hypothetical protein